MKSCTEATPPSAQERLKLFEARLACLRERLALSMWSVDLELRLTWHWGSGLEIFGREENEFLGESLVDRLQGEPEGPAFIDAHLRALRGEPLSYAIVYRDQPTRGRPMRCWLEPQMSLDGDVEGVDGFALDFTELVPLDGETLDLRLDRVETDSGDETGWPADEEVITVGDMTINVPRVEVWLQGERVDLTPIEFRLLVEFARRPGHVLDRETLLRSSAWGYDFWPGPAMVNMAVMRLRSKLEASGRPRMIETVRGMGYRLRPEL